jgi:Fe-S-cluster-containing dehydrogenase component
MKILFVSTNFEKRTAPHQKKPDPEEWVMLVDVDRCISCGSCQLACQIEHGGAAPMPGTFRPIEVHGKDNSEETRIIYLPSACRHCESPCEYYSPYNFWTTCPKGKEQEKKFIACDSCVDRIQQGLWPACATRCSMKTIYFGAYEDISFTLGEKGLREMGDVDFSV